MNSNNLKSETIVPKAHKSFNKFNLNNLNLSLTNSIEKSSFILLKDGTIKQKRNTNSYFEEYLNNKRLSLVMKGDESKIRRAKSISCDDIKKKNLFYKANFRNFKNFDYNENNPEGKVQKINMYENVVIDENCNNDFLGRNINKKNRFSHQNYYNNLNLNFSYNEIIKPSIRNNNICCNCNKYDPKSNCKYDIFNNQSKSNKSLDIIVNKNRYKNLGKYLNKNNINLNNIKNIKNKKNKLNNINYKINNAYSNMINNMKKEENNKTNAIYNFDKFNLTFKSIPQENEKINKQINKVKYTPNHLKIINNEKIEYESKIAKSPNQSINYNKNNNSIEQCRINTKNTNFVSKILSEEMSPIKPNLNYNYNFATTNNNTGKNSVESIFNLSIMNKNPNDMEKNPKKEVKRKNIIIFKNDNTGKFRNNSQTNSYNIKNIKIPNYQHFDQLRNNYNYYERIHKNGKLNINTDDINNRTNYNFKKDFNNVIKNHLNKSKENSLNTTLNNIDNYHKIYFNEKYNNHNISITTNIKNAKNKENYRKTLIYNNSANNMSKSLTIPQNKNKEKIFYNNIINENRLKTNNKNEENNNNIIEKNNGLFVGGRQSINSNKINNNNKNFINNSNENNKNNLTINNSNNYKYNFFNDKIMNTINLIKIINNKDFKNNDCGTKNAKIRQIRKNKSFNKQFYKPEQKKIIHNQVNNPGKLFYNYNRYNYNKACLTIKGDISNNKKENIQFNLKDENKKIFKNNKNREEIVKIRKDFNKIYFDKNNKKNLNNGGDIKNNNNDIKNMTEKIIMKTISNYKNSNKINQYNLNKNYSSNDLNNKNINKNTKTNYYTINKKKEINDIKNKKTNINKRSITYKCENNNKNKSKPKNKDIKLMENNNNKKENNKKNIEDNKLYSNYNSNSKNHKYFEPKNTNKKKIDNPTLNNKSFNDKHELMKMSLKQSKNSKNNNKSYNLEKKENNNNQDYQVYEVNNLKIKEKKDSTLNNKEYKTQNNTPIFKSNKIKKVVIQNINDRYKNINQIRSLKNLLNSSSSTPITLYNNKINNQNRRRINNQNEIFDSMQNERQMKFYDYTFSQKSDNTNPNNNNYYSNSINNFSLNIRSNNLRDLIEEKKHKSHKNLKRHSYSPKIKNNFSFIKNIKNNNHYFIYGNNKTAIIRNIIPDINNISKDEPINYYYNSHSAKIFDEKKFKKLKPKRDKNKKRSLIKEIKYKNKKYKLDTDYNDNIGSNIIYKRLYYNIFKDKIRINSLSESKNMKLKYNFEDNNSTLKNNNNKSLDCIMPPNDLSDIYKKNLIFSQMINK